MASEKRLIELGALIDYIDWDNDLQKWTLRGEPEDIPTVDAVEVVHWRCEYCKDGKSFVGARMLLGNDGKWHDINNCPNCGAKMDGDEGD